MLYREMEAKGKPTPLASLPPLDERGAHYWDAYNALHKHRRADCPIAITDIFAYMDYKGVRPSDRDFWLKAIEELDGAWLKYVADEQQRMAEEVKKHGSNRTRRT